MWPFMPPLLLPSPSPSGPALCHLRVQGRLELGAGLAWLCLGPAASSRRPPTPSPGPKLKLLRGGSGCALLCLWPVEGPGWVGLPRGLASP